MATNALSPARNKMSKRGSKVSKARRGNKVSKGSRVSKDSKASRASNNRFNSLVSKGQLVYHRRPSPR